jgi:hypothetical protein
VAVDLPDGRRLNDRVGLGLGAVDGIVVALPGLEEPLQTKFEIDGAPVEAPFGSDHVENCVEHLEIYRRYWSTAQAGMGYVLKH